MTDQQPRRGSDEAIRNIARGIARATIRAFAVELVQNLNARAEEFIASARHNRSEANHVRFTRQGQSPAELIGLAAEEVRIASILRLVANSVQQTANEHFPGPIGAAPAPANADAPPPPEVQPWSARVNTDPCDGDHPAPACKSDQCWHRAPSSPAPAEARTVREIFERFPASVGPKSLEPFDHIARGVMECECPIGAHPRQRNVLEAAAERDGKVCSLGWPVPR